MQPRLRIDPAAIEHNARLVTRRLEPFSVSLVGVTKACPGDERVAGAMLAGGARALADSRWENLAALERQLPGIELQLLRPAPPARGVDAGVGVIFVSSSTQASTLVSHSEAEINRFCLMVETGDGREGVPRERALEEARAMAGLDGAKLAGLATNAACARPDAPVAEALEILLSLADAIAPISGDGDRLMVSAGGSGLLQLFRGHEADGVDPALLKGITELRAGEALLLGRIPAGGTTDLFLPGCRSDAFELQGPVLEVFEKRGRTQVLVGLGLQETGGAPVIPSFPGLTVTSVTSDYTVLTEDVPGDEAAGLKEGEAMTFTPTYYALAAAMASTFIEKFYV